MSNYESDYPADFCLNFFLTSKCHNHRHLIRMKESSYLKILWVSPTYQG